MRMARERTVPLGSRYFDSPAGRRYRANLSAWVAESESFTQRRCRHGTLRARAWRYFVLRECESVISATKPSFLNSSFSISIPPSSIVDTEVRRLCEADSSIDSVSNSSWKPCSKMRPPFVLIVRAIASLSIPSPVDVKTKAMLEKIPLPDRLDEATDPARFVASFSSDGAASPLRVKEGVVSASVGTGVPVCRAGFLGDDGGESWKVRPRNRLHS